jgi:GNAT superfamily N-acetyltransferase
MSREHDLHWAAFFGIPARDLDTPGTSVVAHVGLAGYRGAWFFRRKDRLVVSAPEAWLERIRSRLGDGMDADDLPVESRLRSLFGRNLERCIGPAFHGAIEPSGFRPARSENVRAVGESDAPAVASFREVVSPDDWRNSGLDEASHDRAAYFEGETISALAGLRRRDAKVADPCVLTHPAHRRTGRGRRVVGHVIGRALARGSVLLYQTLESNHGAVRLALGLGYEPYARHIAVRLTTAE